MALALATPLLRRAAREHRRLERQIAASDDLDPAAILTLGSAVLLHGLFEEAHLFPAHRLLDPSVRDLLAADHEQIGDSLALLEELIAAPAPGADLPSLAAALVDHLRRHVARDARVLYRPLERLAAAPSRDDPEGPQRRRRREVR